MRAVYQKNTIIVSWLIKHEANVNLGKVERDDDDTTAPMVTGRTPLMIACAEGDEDGNVICVLELTSHGANVNMHDSQQCTALILASKRGHVRCVQELLDTDGIQNSVNATNMDGKTALHLAVLYNHIHVVALLIEYNADVNARTPNRCTPLMLAVVKNYLVCAQLLFSAVDIDLNATNNYGQSALCCAAYNGHARMLALLIKHKAFVNGIEKLEPTGRVR
jgi:ankyrin repeat protein